MKKCPPDSIDPIDLSQATQRTISARLRDPNTPDPISHVLTTDLACKLEGSHRSLALSIQQLAVVVGELLVNRALDNLDPPGDASEAPKAPKAPKAPNLEGRRFTHGSIHAHHRHRLPDPFPAD